MPIRPRQRYHLLSRPCRTRRRTRSASTAAVDPATAAATSTAAQQQQQPQAASGGWVSSQALLTSAGRLAAAGEAEADVETPKRGAAAPGEAVSDSMGFANRQSRRQRGRGPERAGTLFADAGRSVGPRGVPKLGSVLPALFHGDQARLSRNCSTDSRSWFNGQMPYGILPQNTTTESREVRVPYTSHLTRPTDIQNSLALAKSAAD